MKECKVKEKKGEREKRNSVNDCYIGCVALHFIMSGQAGHICSFRDHSHTPSSPPWGAAENILSLGMKAAKPIVLHSSIYDNRKNYWVSPMTLLLSDMQ